MINPTIRDCKARLDRANRDLNVALHRFHEDELTTFEVQDLEADIKRLEMSIKVWRTYMASLND